MSVSHLSISPDFIDEIRTKPAKQNRAIPSANVSAAAHLIWKKLFIGL
jgi:hypothetical protein